jgi:type IV secretion system protein VirD4
MTRAKEKAKKGGRAGAKAAGSIPHQSSGAGDKLLIGWCQQQERTRIGFGATSPVDAPQHQGLWLDGEGHLITIAPTGAGKGRGALIPNLLMYEGPAIVIDPKGEASRVTARRRRELGQEVYILDPFNLVTDKTDSLSRRHGR